MTEVGEGVGIDLGLDEDPKCVICGKKHKKAKQEQIQPVAPSKPGWKRKSMAGVFERTPAKEAIYPDNSFPPSYEYQGHHCLALSSLVLNANSSPKDRYPVLNHFLDKVGFSPNQPQNCIGLPAKKSRGYFNPFLDALDADAPLQMHGPAHHENYFRYCDYLLALLRQTMTDVEFCEQADPSEWENKLKELIGQCVNFAFRELAAYRAPWQLHPVEQAQAVRIYAMPVEESLTVDGPGKGKSMQKKSYQGRGHDDRTITFPVVSLDTGPL